MTASSTACAGCAEPRRRAIAALRVHRFRSRRAFKGLRPLKTVYGCAGLELRCAPRRAGRALHGRRALARRPRRPAIVGRPGILAAVSLGVVYARAGVAAAAWRVVGGLAAALGAGVRARHRTQAGRCRELAPPLGLKASYWAAATSWRARPSGRPILAGCTTPPASIRAWTSAAKTSRFTSSTMRRASTLDPTSSRVETSCRSACAGRVFCVSDPARRPMARTTFGSSRPARPS